MNPQSALRRALRYIFGYLSLSILIAAVVALLTTAAELTAQESHHHDSTSANANSATDDSHDHHDASTETLGTVNFPISCSPDVQKPFERAVALMHSFQYTQAKHGFEDVAEIGRAHV